MIRRAATSDGAKEAQIKAFRHGRPINQGQRDECERGYAADEIKRRGVDSEDNTTTLQDRCSSHAATQ